MSVFRNTLAGIDPVCSVFCVYLSPVGKDHVLERITIILVKKTKKVFLFIFLNGPDPARFCVLVTDVSCE